MSEASELNANTSHDNVDMDVDVDVDDEFNDNDDQINQNNNHDIHNKGGVDPNYVASENKSNKPQEHASSASKTVPPPSASASIPAGMPELPELTRKDKTLNEVLELMDDDFAPIIPDTVTDYYLAKNGFSSTDVKIKRLLALATQKFVLDIAQDAYEYSRIRNASSVYNSANPQVRAKQLLQGQQYANQQLMTGSGGPSVEGQGDQPAQQHSTSNAGGQQGKIVLSMDDLSSALSEYGVNTARPDFYR